MNHMLHIAAATQVRLDTPGRAYFRRKLAEGKTRMEAVRCLKRRISDAVYRQLLADAKAAALEAEKYLAEIDDSVGNELETENQAEKSQTNGVVPEYRSNPLL